VDTRSIVVIKTILEEGSFQKAAQRLNCSQSTVTFQVRQLENELSVRLFERLGRRMVFTPAGKSILPHMEAILHSMQAITACNDLRPCTGSCVWLWRNPCSPTSSMPCSAISWSGLRL